MKKRVNITIDPDIHKIGRKVAHIHKTTFSDLIEKLIIKEKIIIDKS